MKNKKCRNTKPEGNDSSTWTRKEIIELIISSGIFIPVITKIVFFFNLGYLSYYKINLGVYTDSGEYAFNICVYIVFFLLLTLILSKKENKKEKGSKSSNEEEKNKFKKYILKLNLSNFSNLFCTCIFNFILSICLSIMVMSDNLIHDSIASFILLFVVEYLIIRYIPLYKSIRIFAMKYLNKLSDLLLGFTMGFTIILIISPIFGYLFSLSNFDNQLTTRNILEKNKVIIYNINNKFITLDCKESKDKEQLTIYVGNSNSIDSNQGGNIESKHYKKTKVK